jgi:PAS domain S-box-containing protein
MSQAGNVDDHDDLMTAGDNQTPGEARALITGRITRQQRLSILATVMGFALLGAACLLSGLLAWRDVEITDAVVDARQARRAGTLVLQALLTAESSQRGFLLTHDPDYLTPYARAATDFRTWLAELTHRLSDPSRNNLAADVGRLGTEKFAEMDRTIALGRQGRFDEAIAHLNVGEGKALMDRVRGEIDTLTADANDAVKTTTATQTRLSGLLLGAIVVALICVALLAILLLRDTRRRIGRLNARESSLSELAATLESEVARRTRALGVVNQRFDAALRASGVTVMTQDRDLVFTWINRGEFGLDTKDIIGRPEPEVFADVEQATALQLKRGVLETGEPARGDVRVMHDGIETWRDLSVHPLTNERGGTSGIIVGAIDITRYKDQEARIRLLMRELTHRSKNLLSVTQAIMRQTAANSTSVEDFESRFAARLQSLAGSHDLLVQEDWRGASLRDLVRSQLGHYTDLVGSQIELEGEPLHIQPDAAQHIGMAMHELATNAAKFGALSVPEGKVHISWFVSPDSGDAPPLCHLVWVESGGPPVTRPSRRGFGRVVSERTVARAVQGDVTVDYAPEGLRWNLTFPAAYLAVQ